MRIIIIFRWLCACAWYFYSNFLCRSRRHPWLHSTYDVIQQMFISFCFVIMKSSLVSLYNISFDEFIARTCVFYVFKLWLTHFLNCVDSRANKYWIKIISCCPKKTLIFMWPMSWKSHIHTELCLYTLRHHRIQIIKI